MAASFLPYASIHQTGFASVIQHQSIYSLLRSRRYKYEHRPQKRVFFFTIEGDTGNTDGLGRNVNQDERSMCARQKAGTPESKCRGEKTTIEMGLLVYEIVFSNREIFQHNRSLMPIRQQELISYVRDGES